MATTVDENLGKGKIRRKAEIWDRVDTALSIVALHLVVANCYYNLTVCVRTGV